MPDVPSPKQKPDLKTVSEELSRKLTSTQGLIVEFRELNKRDSSNEDASLRNATLQTAFTNMKDATEDLIASIMVQNRLGKRIQISSSYFSKPLVVGTLGNIYNSHCISTSPLLNARFWAQGCNLTYAQEIRVLEEPTLPVTDLLLLVFDGLGFSRVWNGCSRKSNWRARGDRQSSVSLGFSGKSSCLLSGAWRAWRDTS